jgi:hypothetical protein
VALHSDFLSAIYPLIAAAVMWFVVRGSLPGTPSIGGHKVTRSLLARPHLDDQPSASGGR